MESSRIVLCTLLSTLLVASIATLCARRLALRMRLVARPRSDRWHEREVPLLGGLGIFGALLFAYAFFYTNPAMDTGWLLGASVVFCIGLVDDIRGLSPLLKLIGQISAACIAVLFGVTLQGVPMLLSVPLTLMWIVAVTNAFNLLDNMDGLAAGTAAISAFALFMQAWMGFEPMLAVPGIALVGAALGFLIFNKHPARIFMGDCGSMVLGFSLATLSVMGASSLAPNLLIALLFPCIVLAVPLFDTSFVSLMRTLNGRPVTEGGRDHTSHRLVYLGWPEPLAVAALWGLSAMVAMLGLFGITAHRWLLLVAGVVIVIGLAIFGIFLAQVEVYGAREFTEASLRHARRGQPVLTRYIQGKRRLAEAVVDFLAMIACFTGVFWLDGGVTPERQHLLNVALPSMLVVQLAAFYLCGVYSGPWREIRMPDLLRISKAIAAGMIAAALGVNWLLGAQRMHSGILINNGLSLLATVAGSRMILRALRDCWRLRRAGERRALIIGAGDAGELALHEILNNRSLNLKPVGFIDDNPSQGRGLIHGFRVFGNRHMLQHVVNEQGVQELIIAIPPAGNRVVKELVEFCDENGIAYREFNGVASESANGHRRSGAEGEI